MNGQVEAEYCPQPRGMLLLWLAVHSSASQKWSNHLWHVLGHPKPSLARNVLLMQPLISAVLDKLEVSNTVATGKLPAALASDTLLDDCSKPADQQLFMMGTK